MLKDLLSLAAVIGIACGFCSALCGELLATQLFVGAGAAAAIPALLLPWRN